MRYYWLPSFSCSRSRFSMGTTVGWITLLASATLAVLIPSAKCGYTCPDAGWTQWGESCYIFSIPSADRSRYANGTGYQNAVSVCKGIGGHLLLLDTLEEAVFAVDSITATADAYLWCTTSSDGLRATCGGASGRYYNSASDNSGFWDWNSLYPRSSTSAQCVVLKTKQPPQLIASPCTIGYTYACEKPATHDGITTTAEPHVITTTEPQQDGNCKMSARFASGGRASPGTCLANHVIHSKYARTSMRCAARCFGEALCKSFNFFSSDDVCQLNSAKLRDVADEDKLFHNGCEYYELG